MFAGGTVKVTASNRLERVQRSNDDAGSAGSGSSSGSSSNSQNSQTGASPSSPAAVYIGINHAASPMVSSRRYDSSNNELEIRRVGGSGYMPLGQAECCDLEDGKKSTNAGKVAEKSKDKMDEDVCSKLSRCCLLS
ncbi:hypothetical protein K0M31_005104 [Melipona bicolor]|uniref:Uncharacterized protein n=1 Tax=Melipona bicolor TaxID=60889 RepID=A0AA40KMZ8_9HYME|nr:hypothetical protein K0M31_005104 [Melipona bicolor]